MREHLQNEQAPLPLDIARLQAGARTVLKLNDGAVYIAPDRKLYGAEGNKWAWGWDSALAIVAIAQHNPHKAVLFMDNFLAGQHDNGMIPHMVMWSSNRVGSIVTNVNYSGNRNKRTALDSSVIKTSNITQKPLFAAAATEIVDNLPPGKERTEFARRTAIKLIAHHEWLYRERELFGDGLVVTVHPHETGRDDAPSHIDLLHAIHLNAAERLFMNRFRGVFEANRTDKDADSAERSDTDTIMRAAALATWRLRTMRTRMKYSHQEKIPTSHPYQHIDPGFNAVLDRANSELLRLAEVAKLEVPYKLQTAMARTAIGLQQLWDNEAQAFRGIDARGVVTFQPGQEISDLLPIYSDNITSEQVSAIVAQLQDSSQFGGPNLPSVNRQSDRHDSDRFWQGADWPFTRMLVINGLLRKDDEQATITAVSLSKAALETEAQHGQFCEYSDSTTGEPKGARNFSVKAAAVLYAAQVWLEHGQHADSESVA